jgi:hypothetical protein
VALVLLQQAGLGLLLLTEELPLKQTLPMVLLLLQQQLAPPVTLLRRLLPCLLQQLQQLQQVLLLLAQLLLVLAAPTAPCLWRLVLLWLLARSDAATISHTPAASCSRAVIQQTPAALPQLRLLLAGHHHCACCCCCLLLLLLCLRLRLRLPHGST